MQVVIIRQMSNQGQFGDGGLEDLARFGDFLAREVGHGQAIDGI